MMEVTDAEIDAYRKERELIEKGVSESDEATDSIFQEIIKLQDAIDVSKSKLSI